MKKISQRIRTNLPKPKTFKIRNYKTPEEKGIITTQTVLKDELVINNKKTSKVDEKKCDFTKEEQGFFTVNGKIFKTIFPR